MSLADRPARQCEGFDAAEVADLCLLLGRTLFSFGATARRVHDSIAYLARRLGCKVDLLVSYDALLISVDDGARLETRIDSSSKLTGLNLIGLVRISQALRSIPASPSGPQEIEKALCAIRDAPARYGVAAQGLAAGCAGAAFCIVNGGDPVSWLCSFVAAACIFAIRRPLAARQFNAHLTVFAIALAGSLCAVVLAHLTRSRTPEIALVAPVLFLVPGVPMINGGIDIVRNHVTLGVSRIGFTMAVLVALCLGVGLTVPLLPAHPSLPFSLPAAWQVVLVSFGGALAAGALACLSNGGPAAIALCALGGLTGRLVRALTSFVGVDAITASLGAVVCSTIVVGFIATRRGWPAAFAAVMAALPMVPGYFAITGLHSLLSFAAANSADAAQLADSLQTLLRAVFISVALVVGVIGPVTILQHDMERV